MFKLVEKMHKKFGIKSPSADHERAEFLETMLFRVTAMGEELNEFQRAILKNDRVEQLDALVDLAVFLFGTAELLGWNADSFEEAFRRVMEANLSKELAFTSKASKRGFKLDLTKPAGWRAADLTDVADNSWKRYQE